MGKQAGHQRSGEVETPSRKEGLLEELSEATPACGTMINLELPAPPRSVPPHLRVERGGAGRAFAAVP